MIVVMRTILLVLFAVAVLLVQATTTGVLHLPRRLNALLLGERRYQ
jgi:hypothetical protein